MVRRQQVAEIKPIETLYNGYRFRSRLEARWAVFFDTLGVRYLYEYEGYVGTNGVGYLPDFFFPDYNIYAEVKGTDEALRKDFGKIISAIEHDATPVSNGLVILGNIPLVNPKNLGDIPLFQLIKSENGDVLLHYVTFWSEQNEPMLLTDAYMIKRYVLGMYSLRGLDSNGELPYCRVDFLRVKDLASFRTPEEKLITAYASARQARFEFGDGQRIEVV